MHALISTGALLVAALAGFAMMTAMAADPGKGPKVGHMVFFTLKDKSPAARQKLVDACDKYLNNHPGTDYYSAGVFADPFDRPVNDREFDVALHLVFASKADHDKYQEAPRHLQFIEENKETWAKVRVFDSFVK